MRPPRPKPVRLETERFLLRSLKPEDASGRWIAWLADAEVVRHLHMPAQHPTRETLARYIAAFDSVRRFLIGTFDKASGAHVGICTVAMEIPHKTLSTDFLVGDKDYWGSNIAVEVGAALLDHFFDARGVEKVNAQAAVRNFPMIYTFHALGFRREAILKGQLRSADGKGRMDECRFGLLKKEWHSHRKGLAMRSTGKTA